MSYLYNDSSQIDAADYSDVWFMDWTKNDEWND